MAVPTAAPGTARLAVRLRLLRAAVLAVAATLPGLHMEFGGYATAALARELDDPGSVPAKLCALTASDPQRYPLFVLLDTCVYRAALADGRPLLTLTDISPELPTGAP